MVRRDSNSSMTERTFRSPSPGRNASARAASPDRNAPPIPSIPKNLAATNGKRSASLEPPMRITSPTPRKGGRYASADRSGYAGAGANRGQRPSDLPKMPELERENSNRSVNFSRPMSPPASPLQRPASASGWFTSPKVGSGTPRTTVGNRPRTAGATPSQETSNLQQNIQKVANQPVAKKTKKITEANSLANGTMKPSIKGTGVAQSPASTVTPTSQPNADATTPTTKKKKTVTSPITTQDADEPPPRNPARVSPRSDGSRSPTFSRGFGTLQKQPSIVREDPEAEGAAERGASSLSKSMSLRNNGGRNSGSIINTSAGPARLYVAPKTPKPRSASLDIPRSAHAHFAEGSIAEPFGSTRFNPPPRSVSPMKSALRHSPSSSVRGTSPNAANRSKAPGSDTSDNNSLASQDGIKAGKRKKSVRVSFDDGSTTVSPAPAATSTPSSVKPVRRDLSPAAQMDDTDDLMQPRPALPSFGSVRERKAQEQPLPAEEVTEKAPSNSTTQPGASSDFAIAGVLANHYAKRRTAEPVPPEVTSVENSGYVSDSSTYSDQVADIKTSLREDTHEPETAEPNNTSAQDITARVFSSPIVPEPAVEDTPTARPLLPDPVEAMVPEISLQPATPGLEEEEKAPLDIPVSKNKERYYMPGAWEESEESKSEQRQSSTTEAEELDSSDDDMGLEAPMTYGDRHPPLLEAIYESESDDSADFSDAPEEPEGFASLDAIVSSPVLASPGMAMSTPPDSPSARLPAPKQPAFTPSPLSTTAPITAGIPATYGSGDWSEATQYWSSLSKQKKELLERQAADEEEESPVLEAPSSKPKKKQTRLVEPMEAPVIASPRSIMSAPRPVQQPKALPSAMKKSMRAEPEVAAPETHMKTSMRSTGPAGAKSDDVHMKTSMRSAGSAGAAPNDVHMRTSMRSGGTPGAMKSSMRDSRPQTDGREPRGALQKKNIPAPSSGSLLAASAAAAQPQPVRKPARAAMPPTDDSDSESSFKKKRRASVSTMDSAGRYNMKRSMRGASVDVTHDRRPISPTPGAAQKGSGKWSLRSLSPTGSTMGGRNRGENIRQSLRGGPADDAPTMRGRNSRAAARDSKSPTRFSMSGFSRNKPPPPAPVAAAPARQSRFASRFAADSDDEDDAGTAPRMGFRSRYNDSDEEDSPVGPPKRTPVELTPVRGIPRRRDQEDDSSDLDDSDDDRRRGRTKATNPSRVANTPLVPSQSDIDKAMEIARRNVAAMNGGREPGVPMAEPVQSPAKQVMANPQPQANGFSASVPGTPTKRRGLLGSVLGRRRTSSLVAVPQLNTPQSPESRPQSPSIRSPKLQRRNTPGFSRQNSTMSTAFQQSAQTQEETVASRQGATTPQNWPLAPPPKVTADGVSGGVRPSTSDGTETVSMRKSMRRPDPIQRSQSGFDMGSAKPVSNGMNGAVYSERTGKKKKFGGLRKLFGLHD